MTSGHKGWREVDLSEVVKITARLVDPREQPYANMVLIAPDHIQAGTGRISSKVTAQEQGAISGKYLVKKNDVIYSKIRPYLMKAAIPNQDVLCSADMYPIECTDDLIPIFLLHNLLSKRFTDFAVSLSGRTGIPKINREELMQYRFYLPPINEQRQITAILSTWDEAIEKTERLLEGREKRFSWLLNRLINQGSVKGEWRSAKLGEVAEIDKGQQLNVADMVDTGKYYALNGGIEPSGFTNNWNTLENTITISEGGNSCGFVNFNASKFWCGGHCYALNNLISEVAKQYLYHFLKAHEQSLMSMRVGSGLPNIQKKDLQKFSVTIPPLSEQNIIAETLNTAQQEIDLLKKQAGACRKQKRGLMQKLLTGEWRVKVG